MALYHAATPIAACEERACPQTALRIVDLSKAYGATVALRRVSLEIAPGEIRALLGENGAGKSTLVKILSGILKPDAGRIEINGAALRLDSLIAARAAGISTAFQELSLLPNLTVADNLALPRLVKGFAGRASVKASRRVAAEVLSAFGAPEIAPATMVGDLSLAQKQRIEIVRALAHRPRLLILDEPTAALAEPEWLFEQIRHLAAAGTAVLYITHRLTEVRRLCDRATILRNGENVGTVTLADTNDAEIFNRMVGGNPRHRIKDTVIVPDDAVPALTVTKLRSDNQVDAISFDLGVGEVLGVAALEGQGQRELFRMLAGAAPIESGSVAVNGKLIDPTSPNRSLRAGIAFLPEERKTEGIFLGLETTANISLSILGSLQHFGMIDEARERQSVAEQARRVDLAERYLEMPIEVLSGGNQQKALFGRVLLSGAKILVLFDPARGVDVGTKQIIYDVIQVFAAHGGSVLIYSTDLEELVQLVDRCLVMYNGRIVGDVGGSRLTENNLIELATGHGDARNGAREARSVQAPKWWLLELLDNNALIAAAIYALLLLVYAIWQPGALTLSAMSSLCDNAVPLALAAAGGTLVVLTRGFDLSVAGVISIANVLVATLAGTGPWAPLYALAIVTAVGLGVGAINGLLVAYLELQSIAATLATMIVCSGIALLILETPGGDVADFIANDLNGLVGGWFPIAGLIALSAAAVWLALRRTDWGVALYAVGADETAAKLAGISVRSVRLRAYCAAGVCYGLAGYMLTALTSSGDPVSGNPYLITVFAAIAIGGTAFSGGRGGPIGSLIGAAILTLLLKVLFSIGILSFATGIAQGLVMIVAVLVTAQVARMKSTRTASA